MIMRYQYQMLTKEDWEKYYWDDTRYCKECKMITPWSGGKCALCEPPKI